MKRTIAVLLIATLAGCLDGSEDNASTVTFDGTTFPDLSGHKLVILSHESFSAFETARELFMNLTNIDDVELLEAGDTGSALARAIDGAGAPEADLIYGLDNAYLHPAIEAGILEPYVPVLNGSILEGALVFGDEWYATPVDQGYVGINWDPDGPGMENVTIDNLFDVRQHADKFVTQNPKSSSPGLGFLLITIGNLGDDDGYDWKDYWLELLDGGVLVTNGWSEAYEGHFSGGYGIFYGGAGDKAIVNSYTESPAVEYYYGTDESELSIPLVAPKTTWHQVQTNALLAGAENSEAAKIWIEFTLTKAYQSLAFDNGVYPVTGDVDPNDFYEHVDPEPGTFVPIDLDYQTIGDNIDRWICEWDLLFKGEEPVCE